MNIGFEFNEAMNTIHNELTQMGLNGEKNYKNYLKEMGGEIKKSVETELVQMKSSEKHPHMADDVKVSLATDDLKEKYVTIGGGKATGWKWHMLNDGTRNHDGTHHTRATHFMEKALEGTEGRLEQVTEKYLRKVTE